MSHQPFECTAKNAGSATTKPNSDDKLVERMRKGFANARIAYENEAIRQMEQVRKMVGKTRGKTPRKERRRYES